MKHTAVRTLYAVIVLFVLTSLLLFAVGPSVAYSATLRGDYALAVAIWRPLAWSGIADAQFNLGLSHARGRGVDLNLEKGLHWYRQAAENGSADAQYNLADYLRLGEGVPRDLAQALVWYHRAAERGYQTAQNSLGMMYAEGNGTQRDLVKAATWFRIAIANGSTSAQANLEHFETQMTREQIAEARAMASNRKK